jgi:hypothetical protein
VPTPAQRCSLSRRQPTTTKWNCCPAWLVSFRALLCLSLKRKTFSEDIVDSSIFFPPVPSQVLIIQIKVLTLFFVQANAAHHPPCFSPPPPLTTPIDYTKGSATPSGTGTPTKRPQTAAGGTTSNTDGNNSSEGEQQFAALAILAHKVLY